MKNFDYYKVSFMGTEELQKEVPLYVSPKPDTLIRVLMKFEGLVSGTEEITINNSSSKRIGFTVVEWGGVK